MWTCVMWTCVMWTCAMWIDMCNVYVAHRRYHARDINSSFLRFRGVQKVTDKVCLV